jgi:hypothetical protein
MTPGRRSRSIGFGSVLFALIIGLLVVVTQRVPSREAATGPGPAVSVPQVPGSTPTESPGALGPTLPPDTQEQLSKQAPGTVIVPCNPNEPVLPEGTVYSMNPAWAALHPGFRYLKHGYCADNPSATPLPDAYVVVPATP